jgi:WD40 repeat protein
VAWSPDGKRLATGSNDGTAKVWDAATGQELLTLRGNTGFVYSVAWSPDGKRLAAASDDKTVQVYALEPHLLLGLAHTRVTRDLPPFECHRYFQSEKCPPLP